MIKFEIKILGSSSATPAYNRHHSAQVLNIDEKLYLIDCGEGTQMQLEKYKVKPNRIRHIFISHLHGDHYLGLFGLISSMHLQKRTKDLYLYGPTGLAEILTIQLKYSQTRLTYKVHFKELDTENINTIFENDFITVETIPLSHSVPCCGFLFKEKPKKRRIQKEKLPPGLSPSQLVALTKGEDISPPLTPSPPVPPQGWPDVHRTSSSPKGGKKKGGRTGQPLTPPGGKRDGEVPPSGGFRGANEELTLPPKKSRSYAYCSDTLYSENIIPQIKNTDLLYHEATFLSDLEDKAQATLHSTAEQAASMAQKANAGKLLIGHFSSRYEEIQPLLEEARTVFKDTMLAVEGETIAIVEEEIERS